MTENIARCIGAVFLGILVCLAVTSFLKTDAIDADGDMLYCDSDADCIPLPSECHPESCINKVFENRFTRPEVCTTLYSCSAAYRPEDCLCINNQCTNKNLGGTCE